MIPSWIINTLIIVLGCIFAVYLGFTLPKIDMVLGQAFSENQLFWGYLLIIICFVFLFYNNFALLLALAVWFPFPPPIPFFKNFPPVALMMIWFSVVVFFRLCMTKKLNYVPSCNLLIFLCYLWVPVRFLITPVQKLGGSVAGGHGVSGANAYFLYVLAGFTVVALGAILNSRYRIMQYLVWSLRFCFIIGGGLLICAFIPATWAFLGSMGMFSAGTMSDGVLRLVVLPGYGLFLVQASLCPALFHLRKYESLIVFAFGTVMMVVGGNRSAMTAAILIVPILFFLRRKTHALVGSLFFVAVSVAFLHVYIEQLSPNDIPVYVRSLGVLDSKIDIATGGSESAKWRYAVWQDGIDKIKENPLMGKGFGNLDKHLDIDANGQDTDFELALSTGLAHNGFISAAYAFGVPFMLGLTLALFYQMFVNMKRAYEINKRDVELRDFYAFIGASIASFGVLIYSAFDLCTTYMWIYVGMGLVMNYVTRVPLKGTHGQVIEQEVHARALTPAVSTPFGPKQLTKF